MEDIKYRFINLNSISTKVHNKQIPKYLPFNEAYNLYQRAKHIGRTDDGCCFMGKQCPQRAVTYCTSNGGNIIVEAEPNKK